MNSATSGCSDDDWRLRQHCDVYMLAVSFFELLVMDPVLGMQRFEHASGELQVQVCASVQVGTEEGRPVVQMPGSTSQYTLLPPLFGPPPEGVPVQDQQEKWCASASNGIRIQPASRC